jgi:cysteinyl-tRNA synthetase
MPISLYNSLSRRIEPFAPLDPNRVTVYLCGPTVYSYVHIGNARGPVVFDVLVKLLRRHYPHVIYARNITDVDDKINAAALEQGVPIGTITGRFSEAYQEDMAGLGIAAPDVEPYATAHIGQIITMIETLIASGNAYTAEGHVLFDVDSYPAYGELSGRDTDELIAGSRVEIAPYKKNPIDFVLWKPSTPQLPGWDSPWGRGRPGWHIECSAMSAAHLGETIDIHAGGVDLQFPHHENEIAQSTCAHGGKVFARWWLHNGMLTFDGRKMSKSLGNVLHVHQLLKVHPPEALRLLLLRGHYRQPLDWSDAAIAQSISTLDGWYRVLRELSAGTGRTRPARRCCAANADGCIQSRPSRRRRPAWPAAGRSGGVVQAGRRPCCGCRSHRSTARGAPHRSRCTRFRPGRRDPQRTERHGRRDRGRRPRHALECGKALIRHGSNLI